MEYNENLHYIFSRFPSRNSCEGWCVQCLQRLTNILHYIIRVNPCNPWLNKWISNYITFFRANSRFLDEP